MARLRRRSNNGVVKVAWDRHTAEMKKSPIDEPGLKLCSEEDRGDTDSMA
jgi:hypothetical protein